MYRTVACLLCNLQAVVKPTKTNRLLLRCDNCGMLLVQMEKMPLDRDLILLESHFSKLNSNLVTSVILSYYYIPLPYPRPPNSK